MGRWFPAGIYDTKHLSGGVGWGGVSVCVGGVCVGCRLSVVGWGVSVGREHGFNHGGGLAAPRTANGRPLQAAGRQRSAAALFVGAEGEAWRSPGRSASFQAARQLSLLAPPPRCAAAQLPAVFEDTSLGYIHDGMLKGQVGIGTRLAAAPPAAAVLARWPAAACLNRVR